MEDQFNGFEKESCLLYGLPPTLETEYIDFINVLKQKYDINPIETGIELKVWMNSTNIIRPSIVITGLPATNNDIKKLMGFLSATQFIYMGDKLNLNSNFECANGNSIDECYSIDEVIKLLEIEREETNDEYTNNYVLGNVDDVDDEVEGGNLHITKTDMDTDNEVHASLHHITEYKNEMPNPEALVEPVPPSSIHTAENKKVETKTQIEVPVEVNALSVDNGNLYNERSKNIQRGLFKDKAPDNHRTIGIWSPLHRTGVTSLTMNFSMFLAENRIDVAVVEGITNQFAMKDWLKRYAPIPSNWISCAKAIQTDVSAINSKWKYSNIMFLPLDKSDSQYEWNTLSLDAYMNTSKVKDIDVTLVDMPTGEMAHYTIDTLEHLDELWIVVDDAIQETLAWKKYITDLKKSTKLPMYIIFNKEYSFSQTKRIEKELAVPMITTIPSLHEETMKNYYEKEPLYYQDEVKELVKVPYTVMATHLFKGDFTPKKKTDSILDSNWLKRILAPTKFGTNR